MLKSVAARSRSRGRTIGLARTLPHSGQTNGAPSGTWIRRPEAPNVQYISFVQRPGSIFVRA